VSPDFAEPVDVIDPVASRDELVVVNPRIPFLHGPVAILRSLRTHYQLASNFVSRDIRLKYRDSALGYVWSLLEPLMLSAVYYFLYVVLAGNADKKHPLYIILGVITWQFFSKTHNGVLVCLTKNEQMIKQVYFPRELFALTTVGSQLVFAFLSLLVAIPLMLYFGVPPTLYLLMVPLGLVLAALLALGVGLALACLNVVNRDVEHLVKFITRVGVFVSPVMWTIDMAPKSRTALVQWAMYNPMTVPITLVRNGIDGRPLGIAAFPVFCSVAFAVVAFLAGAMIFKRYEADVVKKL
jgi:ABC-type polysaccharide/polyol phosphate export permease